MTALVAVAALLAGAVGAVARYAVTQAFAARPARLPWAVLVVNAVGSALGGVLLALGDAAAISPSLTLILLGGFCGGLTTFSTLNVETIQLVLDGRRRTAAASMGLNLVLGIGLAAAAWAITTSALPLVE